MQDRKRKTKPIPDSSFTEPASDTDSLPGSPCFTDTRKKLPIFLLSIAAYAALFMLLYYWKNFGFGVAVVIPVIVTGWLYGCVPAIIVGILSLPANIIMCELVGVDWMKRVIVAGGGIAGTIGNIIIGAVVGRITDLSRQLKIKLHEKNLVEQELKKHRNNLEYLVKEKTVELKESNQQLRASEQQLRAANQQLEAHFQQLKAGQNDIRKANEFLEDMFQAAFDGIIVSDGNGYIIRTNLAFEKMVGYGRNELQGKHMSEFAPPEQKYMDIAGAMLSSMREKGFVENFETCFLRKDETLCPVEFNVSYLKDEGGNVSGSIAMVRDITARKQTEQQIRESKDFLENIFKTTPDMIIVTNAEGIIASVNNAVLKTLGYTPEELIGKRTGVLLPADARYKKQLLEVLGELFEQGVIVNKEFPLQKKDGGLAFCEWNSVVQKNDHGTITGSIAVLRDITERKRFEDQLRQSQKMEAIGTLAGGIAHDFNNILTAIIGYTELSLIKLPKGNPVQDNLNQVLKSCSRAKDLVKQILTFSRKNEQERRPVQFSSIINEAVKLLRASIPTTIDIQSAIRDEEGIVMADPVQLHQVLMNLCTNAAHAMSENGGVLSITLSSLMIAPHDIPPDQNLQPGEYLQLTVGDTGTGIDPIHINRIFEPFYTTKSPGQGTGMGLAVVHGIAKSHGGAITVSSEPGKGAVFTFVLPKIKANTQESKDTLRPIPYGRESILFVDDEESLIDIGSRILSSLGYTVTVSRSSENAFDIFRNNPDKFDLIITDQTMPNMTGYDLARKILEIKPAIPIILCTGYSEKVSEEKVKKEGISAFILKPLSRKEIAETVRNVLDGSAV